MQLRQCPPLALPSLDLQYRIQSLSICLDQWCPFTRQHIKRLPMRKNAWMNKLVVYKVAMIKFLALLLYNRIKVTNAWFFINIFLSPCNDERKKNSTDMQYSHLPGWKHTKYIANCRKKELFGCKKARDCSILTVRKRVVIKSLHWLTNVTHFC